MASRRITSAAIAISLLACWLAAASSAKADSFPWERYSIYPAMWFDSFEARRIAANVLSHQTPAGSWPNGINTGAKKFEGDPKSLQGSFENGATIGEMRFLTRMYAVTKDQNYAEAVTKGLTHIVEAQYQTGGWPQTHPPPPKSYERRIAFCDQGTVGILLFLREVVESNRFAFVRKANREKAEEAFERGVDCIVKSQIEVQGNLSGWCWRHDEKTLQPRSGRQTEPAAVCTYETARILLFLMSIEDPDLAVVRAVHGGCQWLEQVKLRGIRVQKQDGNVEVVRDADAPPLWARCYQIGTNRALFVKQDGSPRFKLADIEQAQRQQIEWYGTWPRPTLEMYNEWKDRVSLARVWAARRKACSQGAATIFQLASGTNDLAILHFPLGANGKITLHARQCGFR